ncbi:hypothetical protein VYU27_009012 [Nannochloropsis oceanica]
MSSYDSSDYAPGQGAPIGQRMEQHEDIGVSIGSGSNPGGDYAPLEGQWKDGLCECWNQWSPSCLLSFFVSCVALAMLSKRTGVLPYWCVLIGMIGCGLIAIILSGFAGILIYVYGFTAFLITFLILRRVRQRYSLPSYFGGQGDKHDCKAVFADCLASCCCTPCVISQLLRHTFNYKRSCDGCQCAGSRIQTLV